MKYFGYNLGILNTSEEVEVYGKNDYVVLNFGNFSPYNTQNNIVSKLRNFNGNIRILGYINLGAYCLTGVSIAATGNETVPFNYVDYNIISQASSYRQYLKNSGGTQTTLPIGSGNINDTYGLLDYTDYCPQDSGGRNFRQWLVTYIITGVVPKYNLDGLFFDEVYTYYTKAFEKQSVDINRDTVGDSAAQISSLYGANINKFFSDLKFHLTRVGKRDYILAYKGLLDDPSLLDINFYERFPETISGNKTYFYATGLINQLITGYNVDVVINEFTLFGSGTTRTQFTPTNITGYYDLNSSLATAYMFDNVMFSIDSGNTNFTTFPTHNSDWYITSSFKKYENPLTDPISTGTLIYRLFKEGLIVLNTGASARFNGITIESGNARIFDIDPEIGFKTGTEELDHGFYGVAGTGVGMHLNHPLEIISNEWMNKVEIMINKISDKAKLKYGPFRFGESDPVCQYFLGDNVIKTFDFKCGIDKWRLSGYSYSDNDPNPNWPYFTDLNEDTNLYYSITYNTPPPTGYFFLIYTKPTGTSFNSSAYLEV